MSGIRVDVHAKHFPDTTGTGLRKVLDALHFAAEKGEFLAIVGPSGCGKTTLLNLIAGLDLAYEGNVELPVASGKDMPAIGYVFQNPRLLPWRTVLENIRLVLEHPGKKAPLVEALLEEAGLSEFEDAYPGKLSLGQCRRAAIVRAFATEPDLLLMDEPFVSLDATTAGRLRQLLLRIWQARPTTVLFVTHDLDEAIALADRILVLSDVPATVVADVPVTIPREKRMDAAAIDEFRRRLPESEVSGPSDS
jgi:ABC-type nitrate/sulfonate/bicarbonate transport system ATPase subunit